MQREKNIEVLSIGNRNIAPQHGMAMRSRPDAGLQASEIPGKCGYGWPAGSSS